MKKSYIEILIDVGKHIDIDGENEQLLKVADGYYLNYCENWHDDITRFSDNELVNVFKGVVLVEKQFDWMGGSAAVGVVLYKEIQDRGLDKELHLADWAIHNTKNLYVPFGSGGRIRRKSRNIVESVLNSQEYSHQVEIEKLNKKERILSEKITGLKNQLSQKSKIINDQKRKLELSEISGVELANAIINDTDRSIYFFYHEIERLITDKTIDKSYLVAILNKFKTTERGKLKALVVRLTEATSDRE